MTLDPFQASMQQLVREAPSAESEMDGRLVERFLEGEEEAFERLVQRHGPVVLGVCRRVVGDPHGAEDAFQATFLVFVRKAKSLRRKERIGNWLYGVAYRTALKARRAALRRCAREKQVEPLPDVTARAGSADAELLSLIDEEVNRLPGKYRQPVVLCELQGCSRQEAARELCCPEGTLSSRLARGRTLLRERLLRRGVTLPGGPSVALLPPALVFASVPPALCQSTVEAGARLTAAPNAVGMVTSPQVAALTRGVLHSMFIEKVRWATIGLLCVGVLGGGLAMLASSWAAPAPDAVIQGDATVAAKIRALIPEASSSSKAELQALAQEEMKPLDQVDNQTLTVALLYLEPPTGKADPRSKDLSYPQGDVDMQKLVRVISRSQSKGYGTWIQPEFITGLTCNVKGGSATGTVSFRGRWYKDFLAQLRGKGEDIYQGCVEYRAEKVEGGWRIEEFRLPNHKIKVVRQPRGNWKQEKIGR
jgi:RNA polymerase sigma factor (sigma-70 family)